MFVAFMAAALIALVVLREFTTPDPRGHSTHEQLGLPACMMLEYTGIPCPGCGVTTAMSSFAHGDLSGAVKTQPFGLLIALLILVVSAFALIDTLRGKDAWAEFGRRRKPWMYWGLGAAMLVAWSYKIIALRA